MTTKLLEDTITFETVPFLVTVEEREMFVNPKKGEVRTVNIRGNPGGMNKTPRGWMICRCRVAKLRPDYPYSIDKEWPDNIDKHFMVFDYIEKPEKREGLLRWGYKTVDVEPERDEQELAEDVIEKMKTAHEERRRVKTLDR